MILFSEHVVTPGDDHDMADTHTAFLSRGTKYVNPSIAVFKTLRALLSYSQGMRL
jgi:hypothetical protein